jgi:hypothetical protein
MTTLFRYETQGRPVTFLDDADVYDNETIRKHWQTSFPELGNCQAETKAAEKDQKLKETTAEGEEVEVDRVVRFVKKVGTKGLPDVDQTDNAARPSIADQVRAWEAVNEEAQAKAALSTAFALHSDPARKRLIDATPRMLAALREAKETLETVLEVAVFYNGNRQVVIDRLARLEAVIGEATGEVSDGS